MLYLDVRDGGFVTVKQFDFQAVVLALTWGGTSAQVRLNAQEAHRLAKEIESLAQVIEDEEA
jgi:hypothetical protein